MSQKQSGGRRIFSEPQAAQYFSTDRLAKMTGRTSGDWHRVVVKDTLDAAYTTKHRAALRDAVREYITETVAAENEEE
jgi:hypothetical protein